FCFLPLLTTAPFRCRSFPWPSSFLKLRLDVHISSVNGYRSPNPSNTRQNLAVPSSFLPQSGNALASNLLSRSQPRRGCCSYTPCRLSLHGFLQDAVNRALFRFAIPPPRRLSVPSVPLILVSHVIQLSFCHLSVSGITPPLPVSFPSVRYTL
ncbi:hypothetical protein R3P38DRAFT_3296693, partial [Favolaschia claudopus]